MSSEALNASQRIARWLTAKTSLPSLWFEMRALYVRPLSRASRLISMRYCPNAVSKQVNWH